MAALRGVAAMAGAVVLLLLVGMLLDWYVELPRVVRRWFAMPPLQPLALFVIAFVAVSVLVLAGPAVDPGLGTFWHRTFSSQANRDSPFSVWGQAPSLHFLQTVTKIVSVALAAAFFFVPGRRATVQLAALAAALLIAVQVTANHWFYPYAVWFAPLVLVAVFAAQRGPEPAAR